MARGRTFWRMGACLVVGATLSLTACIPGAVCNTTEDCPAPQSCQGGHCALGAGAASSSSSGAAPTSCRELLAQNPGLAHQDGVRQVQLSNTDGGTHPVDLWCDMTLAGGGWTLVGRSVDVSGGGQFGWHSSAGSVQNNSAAYSLNVTLNRVAFTEILFGSYAAAKAWDNAYRVTVPANFISAFETAALDVWPPTTAAGACNPPDPLGAPGFMGSYVGFTRATDYFFFRDNDMNEPFGLSARGWDLSSDGSSDCMRNGLLHQRQGMIMVR